LSANNQVDLSYFTEFLGRHRKHLYVYDLGKLLKYGHQICTAVAFDLGAPSDRFTPSLTIFWGDGAKM